jgi:CHASE2 domain-containing sensor protein
LTVIAPLVRAHASWAQAVGALPAKRVVWGLAFAFCIWVLLDVLVLQFTGGISQSSYDAMVRSRVWVADPDPRVLVIDIDEPSLKRMSGEFGRWPWPRDTLATVLDYLERQQPAAIVWDILFSDADRLSPGGDAAFDAAVSRSKHSHFSVARLSAATDANSEISSTALPRLWVGARKAAANPGATSTVAVIPPVLPAIAASRLGYNNGYVDADGVLRRYRFFETLADGSGIQSIAMSVVSDTNPAAYQQALSTPGAAAADAGELIAWRSKPSAYRHIPFADVFAVADGGQPLQALPDFAGKILIVGSTAASLHDIHPTPLAAHQAGVDSLATVLDNTINQRHLRELPRWLDALVAILLCLGLAYWVQKRKIASLSKFTLVLPAGLLVVSYATLNGAPVFVDLRLSAGLALLFLALLRYWNQMRRAHWCAPPRQPLEGWAIWTIRRSSPWLEEPLDHLIDVLEQHSGGCRIVVPDLTLAMFQELRWPELACCAAIAGPLQELQRIQPALALNLQRFGSPDAALVPLASAGNRRNLADAAMHAWANAPHPETRGFPS